MIVDNFHIVSVPIMPDKTDAPLLIDANRVLALAISAERFQLVSGRGGQNREFRRSMKLQELSQSHSIKGAETFRALVPEKLLGVLGAKALDHPFNVARNASHVKRGCRPARYQSSLSPN
jgi:hypothetical protein